MANQKISELPVKVRVSTGDWFTILDVDDNNTNKKARKSALFQQLVTNTSATPSIGLSSNVDKCISCTTPLTSLTIAGTPTVATMETEIQFTTGETFAFTATGLEGKWVGGTPTFEANKSYVITIKNSIAAWGEVS